MIFDDIFIVGLQILISFHFLIQIFSNYGAVCTKITELFCSCRRAAIKMTVYSRVISS